jgi:hypothetical protein
MDKFINIWLPICAIFISIISLFISFSNYRFTRKFEAAKKRTELISNLLSSLAILRNKKDLLFSISKICEDCPKSNAESICLQYDQIIKKYEEYDQNIDKMVDVSDPIGLENAIANQKKLREEIISLTNLIDKTIEKIRNCDHRI